MMNRRLIVWATSLCLMVSVSGIRAGEKLSLKAIEVEFEGYYEW